MHIVTRTLKRLMHFFVHKDLLNYTGTRKIEPKSEKFYKLSINLFTTCRYLIEDGQILLLR